MTLDLSRIEFSNEVFTYETDKGTLTFYALDENPPLTGVETSFKKIIISLTDLEENETLLSSVIGLQQGDYQLQTEYVELEGSVLTLDNIAKCTLEIAE